MTVETATKISQLNALQPPGGDPKSEGDNHLRLIKSCLQAVFDDSTAGTIKFPGNGLETAGNLKAGGNADVGGTLHVTGVTTLDAAVLMKLGAVVYETFALAQVATPANKLSFDVSALSAPHVCRIPNMDSVVGKWEPIGDFQMTAVAQQIVLNLGAFKKLRFSGSYTNSVVSQLGLQFSLDNGATWKSGATDWTFQRLSVSGTTIGGASANSNYYTVAAGNDVSSRGTFTGNIEDFNQAVVSTGMTDAGFTVSAGVYMTKFFNRATFVGPCNALKLFPTQGGTVSGWFSLEGWRG